MADAIFREAMYQLGVSTWKRLIIYYGVRLFGGWSRKIAKTPEDIMNQFRDSRIFKEKEQKEEDTRIKMNNCQIVILNI